METSAFQGRMVADNSSAQNSFSFSPAPALQSLSGTQTLRKVNTQESQEIRNSFCWFPESQQLQFSFSNCTVLRCAGPPSPGRRADPSWNIGEQEGPVPCVQHLGSVRALHVLHIHCPL